MKPLRLISSALLTLAVTVTALPALALDLQQARTEGMVGEKGDGFVAAVKDSPDVQALVDKINAKRAAEYARISKQNGQTPDVVGKLASTQIIGKLAAGSLYQAEDGSWQHK